MSVSERTAWEGRPLLATWLPGYRPLPHESVAQVSGVCLTGDARILLVSEDGKSWSLPGGKPEGTETWGQTLRREIAEEACADLLRWRFLGAQRIEGLTPQPYYQLRFWARVSLNPFHPAFETRHRAAVSAEEYARRLSWGTGPIGQALLRDAPALEAEAQGR